MLALTPGRLLLRMWRWKVRTTVHTLECCKAAQVCHEYMSQLSQLCDPMPCTSQIYCVHGRCCGGLKTVLEPAGGQRYASFAIVAKIQCGILRMLKGASQLTF
jgi:hypothetical protein